MSRMARGAATVDEGEQAWLASVPVSAGKSVLGRVPVVAGRLVLGADAVTFKPMFRIGGTRRYPLGSIVGVDGFADRPARLRVGLRDGGAVVFVVGEARRETSARDEAVREINSCLDDGGG